jgi:pyruvate, water dikinase
MIVVSLDNIVVAWFGEIDRRHAPIAGGKGASLSDMAHAGLPVPPGFVICTEAFRQFLQERDLDKAIIKALEGIDINSNEKLEAASQSIIEKIEMQPLPSGVRQLILGAYQRLCKERGGLAVVAVRSSAAAEDSQNASFAGQQETFLNVFGDDLVLKQVQACWSSFFNPRAIFYRKLKGSLEDTNMAVVVQCMVNPEKSGVMFTMDPVMRLRDRIMIEGAWGLGEAVVSGMITPDNYVVDKASLSLISKFVPRKPFMITRQETGAGVRRVELPPEKMQAQVLSEAEIRQLAALGKQIEAHFGSPQDVEWAIEADRLYILQSRPVTTL